MQLTLLNCEGHQSAGAAFVQQYHLTAQCALRNVSFPSRLWQGISTLCTAHLTPDYYYCYYFTWKQGWSPRLLMAWQWSQALAQRQRLGSYSGGAGCNTWRYHLHLYFTLVWMVESKFLGHITEVPLAWLQFFLVFHLASFEEAADCIPETRCEYPTSTHSYSSPFSHSCLQGGGQQSTSVRANPSSLVELHWGWIQLIALAWKDPKGGSYHISWLPPSASINSDSCTVSKFLGRKESALSPHAYYKGCFQQCATVIRGAQLGNFNPPLSSLELLFMQPAFTQHNGCYLPMCFEGYC